MRRSISTSSGGYDKHKLTVGGILALFPNEDSEKSLNHALIKADVHWASGGLPKRPEPNVNQETAKGVFRLAQGAAAEKIFKLAQDMGVKLLGVAVTANTRLRPKTHIVGEMEFAATHLDMLHRTLLRTLCNYCLLLTLDGDDRTWTILADNRVCRHRA